MVLLGFIIISGSVDDSNLSTVCKQSFVNFRMCFFLCSCKILVDAKLKKKKVSYRYNKW